MGTISSALNRPPRTAAIIGSEDEALTVAATLASAFDHRPAGSGETTEMRLDLVARSGLFGISVSTEHGGIDVSNTVLADVCAIAAAHSTALGDILAAHFVAMEHLRSYGTEGQRNTVFAAVLSGARLARVHARRGADDGEALPVFPSGLATRLSGEVLCTPCTRHAEWVLVQTRQDREKTAGLLLPAHVDGLRYVANTCEPTSGNASVMEHVFFKDLLVDAEALLHATGEEGQRAVPRALELLLDAACAVGAARRLFFETLEKDDADPLRTGLLASRLTAADAVIAEAGRAIDAAQIGLAEQHRTNAYIASAAATLTATEAARDIRLAMGGSEAETTLPTPLINALSRSGALTIETHRHDDEET